MKFRRNGLKTKRKTPNGGPVGLLHAGCSFGAITFPHFPDLSRDTLETVA